MRNGISWEKPYLYVVRCPLSRVDTTAMRVEIVSIRVLTDLGCGTAPRVVVELRCVSLDSDAGTRTYAAIALTIVQGTELGGRKVWYLTVC
jgi:hypothetical protein